MRFGSILIWVDLVTDDATYGRTIHCTGGASTGQDGACRTTLDGQIVIVGPWTDTESVDPGC